ncbi:MAG: hypothetical protein AB1468_02915, partial [Candidatus Micrarchaeota archaeon]
MIDIDFRIIDRMRDELLFPRGDFTEEELQYLTTKFNLAVDRSNCLNYLEPIIAAYREYHEKRSQKGKALISEIVGDIEKELGTSVLSDEIVRIDHLRPYDEVLNILSRMQGRFSWDSAQPSYHTPPPPYEREIEEPEQSRSSFAKIGKFSAVLIIVILAFFLVYLSNIFRDTSPTHGTVSQNPSLNKTFSCGNGSRVYHDKCIPRIACSDGTLDPECSNEKPYQCINGTLIKNSSVCGCPSDYRPDGDSCIQI